MRLNKTRALQLENKMSDGRAIGMNMVEKEKMESLLAPVSARIQERNQGIN